MLPLVIPGYDFLEPVGPKSTQSVYRTTTVSECRPLSGYGTVGTGGVQSVDFYVLRHGYHAFKVVNSSEYRVPAPFVPYAEMMLEVKAAFGRTMSRLPEVFGVSRQTLYNWLAGETPKAMHQIKIVQLAAAARLLSKLGVKPTPDLLDQPLLRGKSFLELLADGTDGAETAVKLVQVAKRSSDSRSRLDAILNGRKTERPDIADMGSPSLAEDI